MKIALVGATGMVGGVMLKVLQERNFPVSELIPVASSRSVGQFVPFAGENVRVVSMTEAIERQPDFALFSAGGETSRAWAPKFAEVGCCVIDNSSAWRMDADVKLIVPEVNGHVLNGQETIIANPNCSTIQLVAALHGVHRQWGIKRLVISTYQSVTGTGKKAVDQLEAEKRGETDYERVYPHRIFENCLPHCDVFLEDGYSREETKLVYESRKILASPDLAITATAVRVPVWGGHSESVNVELANEFVLDDVINVIKKSDGVIIRDDCNNNVYPTPLDAYDKDEVFVGRIRLDPSQARTFNCWIVADNLRKGAATNAVQIAERMAQLRVTSTKSAVWK